MGSLSQLLKNLKTRGCLISIFPSECDELEKHLKGCDSSNNNNYYYYYYFKVCCKCKISHNLFLAAQHWFFFSYTHQCDQLQRIFFLAAKLMKVSQQASCEWHVRERERESERERGCLWAQSLTRPLPEALMDICPMTDWLTYRQADSRGRGLNLYTNT